MNKGNIVLGISGGIAAYKSVDILRCLMKKGFNVSVVMTKSAGQFITPLTLSSLANGRVYFDLFEKEDTPERMPHIDLASFADLILIAPATANIIGKMANGLADDLLSCIVMATAAKIVVAPAMNTNMYKNVFVQDNCQKLKKHGIEFVDPIEGHLACGVTGDGHIADTEEIVECVAKKF